MVFNNSLLINFGNAPRPVRTPSTCGRPRDFSRVCISRLLFCSISDCSSRNEPFVRNSLIPGWQLGDVHGLTDTSSYILPGFLYGNFGFVTIFFFALPTGFGAGAGLVDDGS